MGRKATQNAAVRARAGLVDATAVPLDRPDTTVTGPDGQVFNL